MVQAGIGQTLRPRARFLASGVTPGSLTVLFTMRDIDGTAVVNAQAATPLGDGFFGYDSYVATEVGPLVWFFNCTAGTVDIPQMSGVIEVVSWLNSTGGLIAAALGANSMTAAAAAADFGTEIATAVAAPSAGTIATAVAAALDIPTTAEIVAAVANDRAIGTTTGTPTTTSIQGTGSELASVDSRYVNSFLVITEGPLKGLARKISAYTGSTKTFTVEAFPAAPAASIGIAVIGNVPSA